MYPCSQPKFGEPFEPVQGKITFSNAEDHTFKPKLYVPVPIGECASFLVKP